MTPPPGPEFDWAAHTEAVAADVFGEPNAEMSRPPDDVRFGNHGSVSVNYTTGQWYDFENERGGGIKELIRVYKEIDDRDAAIAYAEECQQNFENGGEAAPERQWKAGQPHQQEVEATYPYRDASGQVAFEVVRFVFKQGEEATSPTRAANASRPSASAGPRGNPTKVGCGGSMPANSCAARRGRNGPNSTPLSSSSTPPPGSGRFSTPPRRSVPYQLPDLLKAVAAGADDLHRRGREEGRSHSQLRFSRDLLRRRCEQVEPRAQRIPAGRRRCAAAG